MGDLRFPRRSALAMLAVLIGTCAFIGLPSSAYAQTQAARAPSRGTAALESLIQQADQLRGKKRYAEATEVAKRALARALELHGPDSILVSARYNALALLYRAQGRQSDAVPLFRKAFAIFEGALGSDHSDIRTSLRALADALQEPPSGMTRGSAPPHQSSDSVASAPEAAPSPQDRDSKAKEEHKPDITDVLKALEQSLKARSSEKFARSAERSRQAAGRGSEKTEQPSGKADPRLLLFALPGRDKAWLGVELKDVGNSKDAHIQGSVTTKGAVVTGISPNSPAATAGLQLNDVIVGMEAPPVRQNNDVVVSLSGDILNAKDLAERIGTLAPGSHITVHLHRKGQPRHVKVTLGSISSDDHRSLALLAARLREHGKYAKAERLLKRAIPVAEKRLGRDHPDVAVLLNNLGAVYFRQGRFQEAEPLGKRALVIVEKAHGPDRPEVVTELENLARIYRHLKRFDDAEPLLKRALSIREKEKGPDHPLVASRLGSLGRLYYELKRYGEAEPLLRRAVGIYERVYGPDHPELDKELSALARVYYAQDRFTEALPLVQRELALAEKAHGPDQPKIVINLDNLAKVYRHLKRFDDAEPLLKRALSVREKEKGPDHPAVATSLVRLGTLHREQGRKAEADALLKRALDIQCKGLGPYHSSVAATFRELAAMYGELPGDPQSLYRQGKRVEAERAAKQSIAIHEKVLGGDHPLVASWLVWLGRLYSELKRYGEAEPLLRRAIAIYEGVHGPDHPEVGRALSSLARVYYAQGRSEEAQPLYQRALAIADKAEARGSRSSDAGRGSQLNLEKDASSAGATPPGSQVVTVSADRARARKVEILCRSVEETRFNGALTRICDGGNVSEFAVTLADGTQAWCDGRKFAVYNRGGLQSCRLKRPLIVANENGIARCNDKIQLTIMGNFSRCITVKD